MPELLQGKGSRRPDAERVRRRAPFVPAIAIAIVVGAGVAPAALVVLHEPWQVGGGEHGHGHGDGDGHEHGAAHDRHGDFDLFDAVPAVPNAAEGVLRPLDRIRAGDCVNDTVVDHGVLRVLECASPHRFEVFATVTAATVPSRPTGEQERGEENVSLCVAELSQGRLRAAADDPATLVDAVDDFGAPAAGRRVVCAIGYNDFRQTVGHRGRWDRALEAHADRGPP